jgi:hypothetical protein
MYKIYDDNKKYRKWLHDMIIKVDSKKWWQEMIIGVHSKMKINDDSRRWLYEMMTLIDYKRQQ